MANIKNGTDVEYQLYAYDLLAKYGLNYNPSDSDLAEELTEFRDFQARNFEFNKFKQVLTEKRDRFNRRLIRCNVREGMV